MKLSTRCVHAGTIRDDFAGGVNTPIHVSSAHVFPNPHRDDAGYPRYNNIASQIAPAEKLAALEGADDAIVTASGLAAINMTLLTLLEGGDHAVYRTEQPQKGRYGSEASDHPKIPLEIHHEPAGDLHNDHFIKSTVQLLRLHEAPQ